MQEMVDSEAAGVLFTVNPNDGDPSRMILTANFGLGESVVSGHAEPDTFILKRTSSGHISVSERTIGSKHLKFVLTQDGSREEEMGSSNSATSCLSDEMALKLGQLGVFLEKSFGGPRDIEFGIRNDSVYLLQVTLVIHIGYPSQGLKSTKLQLPNLCFWFECDVVETSYIIGLLE